MRDALVLLCLADLRHRGPLVEISLFSIDRGCDADAERPNSGMWVATSFLFPLPLAVPSNLLCYVEVTVKWSL